jgi:glutamate dehydrogenase
MQLMTRLERSGRLDRKLEFLPDDMTIIERDLRGGGLTRPELAVLMAYAKIALFDDIAASGVPDDPYLSRELKRYFPQAMQERFGEDIEHHKLRREIIATMLANSMINRGGPGFVAFVIGETHATPTAIAAAFAVARDSLGLIEIGGLIDTLDNRVPGILQNRLYAEMQRLIRWTTVWFLRHERLADGLEHLIARYRGGLTQVEAILPAAMPESQLMALRARQAELEAAGVPRMIAARLAKHRFLMRAPDIVKIASVSGAALEQVAAALYGSAADLGMDQLIQEGSALKARDLLERQAINRLMSQVFQTHRDIVTRVVREAGSWPDWRARNQAITDSAISGIEAILASKPFDIARFAVAQGTLADLAQT